ncbi:uncharacterized protein MONBRDRAFT_11723 [Monosiga brevicollis MX1]|uniref:Uncharacterized protein n=1 Tax=Monosiga brevicollis TaxID=81824 RepID=A9VA35_MONBE|nr:uncharacterized protein MONBRDRAFT_11723 [Monosiga brevicollis MX1]EDQ85597.1 predicted protein [Monosiga brevicollis MX1]|eukprot:XP_001749546.1 hypothetical protein [Monosiga brevicollis MX1]
MSETPGTPTPSDAATAAPLTLGDSQLSSTVATTTNSNPLSYQLDLGDASTLLNLDDIIVPCTSCDQLRSEQAQLREQIQVLQTKSDKVKLVLERAKLLQSRLEESQTQQKRIQDQLNAKDKECLRYRRDADSLRLQLRQASANTSQTAGPVTTAPPALTATPHTATSSPAETAALQAQLTRIEKELDTCRIERDASRASAEQLQAALQDEHAERDKKLEALRRSSESARQQRDKAQTDLKATKQLLSELRRELAEAHRSRASNQRTVALQTDAPKHLNPKATSATSMLDALADAKAVKTLSSRVETLTAELTAKQQQLTEARQENAALETRLMRLEALLHKHNVSAYEITIARHKDHKTTPLAKDRQAVKQRAAATPDPKGGIKGGAQSTSQSRRPSEATSTTPAGSSRDSSSSHSQPQSQSQPKLSPPPTPPSPANSTEPETRAWSDAASDQTGANSPLSLDSTPNWSTTSPPLAEPPTRRKSGSAPAPDAPGSQATNASDAPPPKRPKHAPPAIPSPLAHPRAFEPSGDASSQFDLPKKHLFPARLDDIPLVRGKITTTSVLPAARSSASPLRQGLTLRAPIVFADGSVDTLGSLLRNASRRVASPPTTRVAPRSTLASTGLTAPGAAAAPSPKQSWEKLVKQHLGRLHRSDTYQPKQLAQTLAACNPSDDQLLLFASRLLEVVNNSSHDIQAFGRQERRSAQALLALVDACNRRAQLLDLVDFMACKCVTAKTWSSWLKLPPRCLRILLHAVALAERRGNPDAQKLRAATLALIRDALVSTRTDLDRTMVLLSVHAAQPAWLAQWLTRVPATLAQSSWTDRIDHLALLSAATFARASCSAAELGVAENLHQALLATPELTQAVSAFMGQVRSVAAPALLTRSVDHPACLSTLITLVQMSEFAWNYEHVLSDEFYDQLSTKLQAGDSAERALLCLLCEVVVAGVRDGVYRQPGLVAEALDHLLGMLWTDILQQGQATVTLAMVQEIINKSAFRELQAHQTDLRHMPLLNELLATN